MRAFNRRTLRRSIALAASALLCSSLAVGFTAEAAHADPGCQRRGAYVLFARGSGANIGGSEAKQFNENIHGALGDIGINNDWAELGNLDGDVPSNDTAIPNDANEFPAPAMPYGAFGYLNSIEIGKNELVTHLNQRYGSGPGDRNCYDEVAVIGGYSAGADVVGWALQSNSGLSGAARRHIAFAALYGDPRMSLGDGNRWWQRGNIDSQTYRGGFLGPRYPYAPDEFIGRLGSWCDTNDHLCKDGNGVFYESHTTEYKDTWIAQSGQEIARAARNRLCLINLGCGNGGYATGGTSAGPSSNAGANSSPAPTQGPGVGNSSYLGSDILSVNQPLYRGQFIMTPEGNFVLYFQPDGNLVLYGHTFQPIWASYTGGGSGAFVVLQPDGNWVMYSGSGQPVWYNGANGTTGNRVVVQPDGNLVEYNPYGQAVWNSGSSRFVPAVSYFGSDHLEAGQSLNQRQYLRSGGGSGTRFLLLQEDGNLVLYGPGYHYLWNSGTGGTGACHLDMQPDGNLVLYTPDGRAVWSSGTSGVGVAHADMQPDGNFVIYSASGQAVWWSGTGGMS